MATSENEIRSLQSSALVLDPLIRTLAEKTKVCVLKVHRNGKIAAAAGHIEAYFKRPGDEILNQSIFDVLTLYPYKPTLESIRSLIRHRSDGELRVFLHQEPVNLSLHFQNDSQNFFDVILSCGREEDFRFRQISDAAPFFIWIFQPDGHCDYMNRVWQDFRGKISKHRDSWKESMSPKDAFIFESAILAGIKNRKPFECEIRMERGDGAYRWVLWRGMPRFSENGAYCGIVTTGLDITTHKEIQLSLEKSSRDLERSNQELEEFAYVASHDLQEPLRMISSFIELFREEYASRFDSQADEYMGFILDAAHRMRSLITDLLAYSRVGRTQFRMGQLKLSDALQSARLALQSQIDSAGAQLEVEPLPEVEGNLNQLSQVFQNMIENALKYRSAEAPKIKVQVSSNEHQWTISVSDNGIGFDMRFHDRVFQLFGRLHGRERYPGSGMGLAISKKIVEAHGGSIWAESKPGNGSTFYFSLPRSLPKQGKVHE